MQKKERLGFNIVLLGQIASGKDTQAKILMKKYAMVPVETGKFTRMLMKAKTKDGELFRKIAGSGKPAPVSYIKNYLASEIAKKPKNKDILFFGGPRLKPEAQLLKKLLTEAKQNFMVFYITLPDAEVYKRSFARKEGSGAALFKMLDAENLIKKRINWHKTQVSKTVNYFDSLGKLKKINGKQPVEKVAADISKAVLSWKKRFSA